MSLWTLIWLHIGFCNVYIYCLIFFHVNLLIFLSYHCVIYLHIYCTPVRPLTQLWLSLPSVKLNSKRRYDNVFFIKRIGGKLQFHILFTCTSNPLAFSVSLHLCCYLFVCCCVFFQIKASCWLDFEILKVLHTQHAHNSFHNPKPRL